MTKEKLSALCKAFLWCICILLFPILSGTLSAILSLGTIETLFLQGIFMLLSLAIPLIFIMSKKWSWHEIGFAKINRIGYKKALFFLPTLAIFIPVTVDGFYIKSTAYVLVSLFLYLSVGISEEVYFRGIIPKYLSLEFSLRGVIVLSAIIFGVGHIASAFTADSGFEIFLNVLNAFIFGWLAIEMSVICKSIVPGILLHAFFDFETKIVAMIGQGLLIAECVRGVIMVAAAVWLGVLLKKPENH